MTTPVPPPTPDRTARLGRALMFVHAQEPAIDQPVVKAQLGTLLAAGRAMDFAARLRNHGRHLTGELAARYAEHAGISLLELRTQVLPALASADVVVSELDGASIKHIEEYVGLSAPIVKQAIQVLDYMSPNDQERAVLHSVEVASWAPLTEAQHLEQLIRRGFGSDTAAQGLKLALASRVNRRVKSTELREYVVYNPNVWGAKHVQIAGFLRGLPPGERDALLGMCEQATDKPGLAIPNYGGFNQAVLTSAKKVGLIQAATVKSTHAGAAPQTYVFSPLLEAVDDTYVTTEALHQRKLFVAHILYGHEKAIASRGQIRDPLVLVNALLRKGWVGPASNIATDYHLVEASGILRVEDAGNGRALLRLVKPEIVEGGLAWLERALGASEASGDGSLAGLRPPGTFTSPEVERAQSDTSAHGVADEITTSAVLKLREAHEEAQRAARYDF